MRASVSHYFGRNFDAGMSPWTESVQSPGLYTGNPSISNTVSKYMCSLRRRKVRRLADNLTILIFILLSKARGGETVVSAKAINSETMKKLWEINTAFPKTPVSGSSSWAGHRLRAMMQVLYITSFLCLLRSDEALRIQCEDVDFEDYLDANKTVNVRVKLTLPF